MTQEQRQTELNRVLLACGGLTYLAWWVVVHLALPQAFNPIAGRALVVAAFLGIFAASFVSARIARDLGTWLAAGCWLATAHYFYLFYENRADSTWMVGAYITITAVCAMLQSTTALLSYSVFATALSVGMVALVHNPAYVIFIPGMLTILGFANLGQRWRLRLLVRFRESSQKVSSLFDACFEGIAVHDGGVIREVNGALARLLGYTAAELIGMASMDVVAPDSRPIVLRNIGARVESPYELELLRKDGTRVLCEAHGKVHVLNGKEMRLVAFRDLTDRKRAERDHILYEATREAVRLRDDFISIASHELRTPLTSLKLRVDLARRNLAQGGPDFMGEPAVRFIQKTGAQVDRMIQLVEDILDVSRLSTDQLNLRLEPLDLSEVARDAALAMADVLKQAGCDLSLELQPGVAVNADRAKVEQVVRVLLSNVVKYGRGRPAVLSVRVERGQALLAVADHGVGIAKADQARIFQKFERVDSTHNVAGLGLGLYICRELVEAHRGTVEVESEPGQGATFRVRLPLAGNASGRVEKVEAAQPLRVP